LDKTNTAEKRANVRQRHLLAEEADTGQIGHGPFAGHGVAHLYHGRARLALQELYLREEEREGSEKQIKLVTYLGNMVSCLYLGQPKDNKVKFFLPFSKFMKRPQTKFHADTMIHSKDIRTRKCQNISLGQT